MSRATPTEISPKNARIADDVDRISDLPDGIVSHILSNLPIKDAVRTSVLSKYWEFKWTSIYNLHIDQDEYSLEPQGTGGNSFRNIVDKMLLHLNNIKRFSLDCSCVERPVEPYAIASWISAVFRQCNIESVELSTYELEDFVLPRSLLGCTSLRNLVLDIESCIFKVPAKICFPNLASLELDGVKIVNEHSGIDIVKFTFPVLEKLTLAACEWSNVKYVEFFAPSLTSFKTSDAGFADFDGDSIKIIGSRIADFHTSDSLGKFVLTDTTVASAALLNSSSYIDAEIRELGFRVRKLLRQVSSLQYLELSNDVLKAIAQSKTSLSLPRYSELKTLYVVSPFGLDVEGLLEILHASPFLEFLIIFVNDLNEYNYDAIVPVPSCILSCLKQIKFVFLSMGCKNPQFLLEKFLLKNALELKNIYVSGNVGFNSLLKEKLVKQLSEFPKGSKCVTIESKDVRGNIVS